MNPSIPNTINTNHISIMNKTNPPTIAPAAASVAMMNIIEKGL